MRLFKSFFSSNWKILLMAVAALLFAILWIHDSGGNILSYDNPESTEDVSQISYASKSINHSGAAFTVNYKAWNLQKVGLRLYMEDTPGDGTVSVTISDSSGVVDTVSCSYSDVVSGDVTWFPVNKSVKPGSLRITVEAAGNTAVGVSVYTDGNDTTSIQTRLETHFVAVEFNKEYLYLAAVLMVMMTTILFLMAKGMRVSWPQLFLVCWMILGILYFLILPVLAESDAGNHFRRAFAIATGRIFPVMNAQGDIGGEFSWPNNWTEGDSVQISFYQQLHDWPFKMNADNTTYISYKNMALYSPLCYLPQIAGMLIGRMLTDRLVPIIFLARLFNFLCTGALLYLAVRLTPFGKKYILWISLLPMVMELGVGIAPDSMALALITLLTALVLRLRYTDTALTPKYLCGISLLSLALSQYKLVYVVFSLLLFLIPQQKFGSRKKYLGAVCGIGVLTAVPAALWLHVSSGILKAGYSGASSNAEVLRHPLHFLMILFRTLIEKGGDYVQQAAGSNMGALSFGTDLLIVLLLLILFAVNIGREQASHTELTGRVRADRKLRLMLTGCILLTSLLIFMAEFVQWTDAGSKVIDGVQGRYFLPFLFPVLVLVCGAGSREERVHSGQIFGFLAINLCFLSQLMMHYLVLGA